MYSRSIYAPVGLDFELSEEGMIHVFKHEVQALLSLEYFDQVHKVWVLELLHENVKDGL